MRENTWEDLRFLWQQQVPPGCTDGGEATGWPGVLTGMRQYERRVFRINRIKTAAAGILLLMAGTILLPGRTGSWLVTGGLAWIAVSMTVFLILYWRWQFRVDTLPLERSTLELIRMAQHALSRERTLFWRGMPLLGVALIAGLQLIYLDLLREEPLPDRLLWHGTSVLALLTALAGGLRFRQKRFQREMQPLLNRLQLLEKSFMENES